MTSIGSKTAAAEAAATRKSRIMVVSCLAPNLDTYFLSLRFFPTRRKHQQQQTLASHVDHQAKERRRMKSGMAGFVIFFCRGGCRGSTDDKTDGREEEKNSPLCVCIHFNKSKLVSICASLFSPPKHTESGRGKQRGGKKLQKHRSIAHFTAFET